MACPRRPSPIARQQWAVAGEWPWMETEAAARAVAVERPVAAVSRDARTADATVRSFDGARRGPTDNARRRLGAVKSMMLPGPRRGRDRPRHGKHNGGGGEAESAGGGHDRGRVRVRAGDDWERTRGLPSSATPTESRALSAAVPALHPRLTADEGRAPWPSCVHRARGCISASSRRRRGREAPGPPADRHHSAADG